MTFVNPFPIVLAILKETGWGKGQARSASGALCLGAALNAAREQFAGRYLLTPDMATIVPAAIYAAGYPPVSVLSIPVFNDAPERTWEDIVLVLKHAERIWDERHSEPVGG